MTIFAAAMLAAGAACAAEVSIDAPAFDVPRQAFTAPAQTGEARHAKVNEAGLYELPEGMATTYSVGRPLAVLGGKYVFLRVADDVYSGSNVVWTGELTMTGEAGQLPAPPAQGRLSANGAYAAICRTERNEIFHHNYMMGRGPTWYFDKPCDIIGSRKNDEGERVPNPVSIEVAIPQPLGSGKASVSVALASRAPKDKANTLRVLINDTEVIAEAAWKGPGYRVISQDFDGALLHEGANTVTLIGDSSYVKHLDWVEIAAPAQPCLQGGQLIIQAEADGECPVPGAQFAADITDFGAERMLTPSDSGAYALKAGRLYGFFEGAKPLNFSSAPVTLETPNLADADYVAVAMRANLPALAPLLEAHTAAGLRTAAVAFEDLQNVYNGGLYGPEAIRAMVQAFHPKYLLLAGGFHRDCRGREAPRAQDAAFHPGIPACFVQVEQVTVNDDPYTLDHTVRVGRVPINDAEGLRAWAAKAASMTPSDYAVMLAGHHDELDFTSLQREQQEKVPSALVSAEGQEPGAARETLLALMQDGAWLVVYQGHAQSWEVDKGLLGSAHGQAMPPSNWVLATCNGAYYHADYDMFLRDWMRMPGHGCVNALASASVGAADQQDMVVRRFVEYVTEFPEGDWGGAMQFLKRNLPFAEKMMKDDKLPPFLKNRIPQDRMTIDAYSLLGDPAASILPAERRKVVLEPLLTEEPKRFLPPGPVTLSLTLSGPWQPENPDAGQFAVQWRLPQDLEWQDLPGPLTLQDGKGQVVLDAAAMGHDGGHFALRAVERREGRPPVSWTSLQLIQECLVPGKPAVIVRQMKPAAEGPQALLIAALDRQKTHDRQALEAQFQIREAAAPETVIVDTGWLSGFRYDYTPAQGEAPREIRARLRKRGNMSDWSDWAPLAPQKPQPRPEGQGNAAQQAAPEKP